MKTYALLAAILLTISTTAKATVSHPLPTYELPPVDGRTDVSRWAITPPPTPTQAEVSPTAAVWTPGDYMQVRVLVVIYANTAGGTVSQYQIDKLKSEVAQAQLFYWRNSRAKCYVQLTYMVIDDYKEIDEFWKLGDNAYWMTFWDTDGDGRSVEQDLRDRGITDDQYSAVFNFYAWGQNGWGAAYGGGAYGVDVGLLGRTAYAAVPLCWDPNTNDWYFIHEFHHELDDMFRASGYPEYPHADIPQELPGDFGQNYDFNAFMLRNWPDYKWTGLHLPWGQLMSAADADLDGLPDSASNLPFTEAVFNSSTTAADTDSDGLDDLHEFCAGLLRSSVPYDTDTDNDGIVDGMDKYPIYAIDEYTPRGTRTIDGSIEPGWHVLGSPLTVSQRFTSTIRTNWDPNYLYLAFSTSGYSYLTVNLDGTNDGWFHGKDNYEIAIDPGQPAGSRVRKAHILDCSSAALQTYGGPIWDDDSRYTAGRIITEPDIRCGVWSFGGSYTIEIAIPRNTTTGLVPANGARIGLLVIYDNVNSQGLRAIAFEPDVLVDLVLVDQDSWTRDAKVANSKGRADGEVVDLLGKTVSAVFNGGFYLEDPDRSSGIKVVSDAVVAEGDIVRVIGRLSTSAGERELQNAVVDRIP